MKSFFLNKIKYKYNKLNYETELAYYNDDCYFIEP